MWDFLLTVRNTATGEEAKVRTSASDPDDACCLENLADVPLEWGDEPDLEVTSVEFA